MHAYDAGRWVLLATLWSLQFLFLRLAVPVFGTAPVAESRAFFAALFLLPWVVWFARQRIAPLENWKDYLAIGLANNVLPFFCFNRGPRGLAMIQNSRIPSKRSGDNTNNGRETNRHMAGSH